MKPYVPKFTEPKPPKKPVFRPGLVSISFRKNTQREILSMMKEAGLTYIEWGSDVHAPHRSLGMLNELAQLQAQFGVSCCSYGTYFRIGETPTEELIHYIEAARILGTDVLRLWAGRKCGKDMSLSELDKFMSACWGAIDIAERENVKICLECHVNSFTERLEDTLMLMDNAGSDNFRMYWQPFRARSFEENAEYLRQIEQYVENIHVFNWDANGRYPLGDAIEEWKKYTAILSRPRTMLLEFMPDDELATLPREAEALKRIISE